MNKQKMNNRFYYDMKKINVVIAEDHMLTAKLLSKMLAKKKNINIIDTASNGLALLNTIESNQVDVVLMDLSMPVMDGIQATRKIHESKKDIKILMLSGHTEGNLIKTSLESGASGYLSKTVDMNEISDAVERVYEGGTYFDDIILESLSEIHSYSI
jgi:two-component system, NarL family, nitrate/nitrite response regulator NarL